MLNKLASFLRRYDMVQPGDTVVCAVSGGADSVALLFAMYLLKEKLDIRLEAAHFNHRLRGEESDRDEAFVRDFCRGYQIPLHVGSGQVVPGRKGLEAAARDARYAFLETLEGKLATAHTADDNAETVLMHLVRGTGLKGLGGISPVRGRVIRPMLAVTRQDVLAFLEEYSLPYVTDSSNDTDAFLRNRLRRHVMPLLKQENPRLSENLSAMALRLREDEQLLSAQTEELPPVSTLRQLPGGLRSRLLGEFLKKNGVKEPDSAHIARAEALVFSYNPSAWADFPGGVTVSRRYDRLTAQKPAPAVETTVLRCPGVTELPEQGLRILCSSAESIVNEENRFTVRPQGQPVVRTRLPGDAMRLPGGTKTLKKLFVDRKIPASQRAAIPVIADETGVLGVYGIGANRDTVPQDLPAVEIRFEAFTEK